MNTSKSSWLSYLKQTRLESLFFIFLLIFAIAFAKERIINSDAAFYLFNLINYKFFNIEQGRLSTFITQIPVQAAIKAGLNLKVLIYIYSITFPVLFWLVYKIIRNPLKNKAAALALLMLILVGVNHCLYRPVSESTQGMVYAMILFAILYHDFPKVKPDRKNAVRLSLAIFTILFCYFSHPITVFPILFIIGFYIIDNSAWKDYRPWLILAFTLLLFTVKVLTTQGSSYEGDKLSALHDFSNHLLHFYKLYPTHYILHRLPKLYLVSGMIFLVLNVYYIHQKDWPKWILLDVFVLGFVIIHNLIYYAGGSDIELDKNLMTVNFFLYIPFAKEIFYHPKMREWQQKIIMLFLLLFSIVMILHPAKVYTQRIRYYQALNQVMQQQQGSKFYTEKENIDKDKVLFEWGVPYESMVISSLDGPSHSKTLYLFDTLDKLPEYIHDPDLFLYVFFWERRNIHELNQRYFKLPAEPYRYLSGKMIRYAMDENRSQN